MIASLYHSGSFSSMAALPGERRGVSPPCAASGAALIPHYFLYRLVGSSQGESPCFVASRSPATDLAFPLMLVLNRAAQAAQTQMGAINRWSTGSGELAEFSKP